jgi:23S rRNA (cytosine1962-C5)-methyltransferase
MPIQLNRAAASAVRRGHPWVYRDGLVRPPSGLASGDVVEIIDDANDALGVGLWDAESPICARVFERAGFVSSASSVSSVSSTSRSRGRGLGLDAGAIARRIEQALVRRDALFGEDRETTAYRLCNGEGDRVPGLVLDRYGDVAVLRLDGAFLRPWLDRLRAPIAASLERRGFRAIGLRTSSAAAGERGAKKIELFHGRDLPDRVTVRERGVAMEVDLAHGQKTGAFLDQRENRARVRALARGRARACNLFSYAGGFSIAAALGGAASVTSVDIASAAHATAQRTFRANGVDPARHAFVAADAFAFLEQAKARGDRFDLVISDPPSFAPSERAKSRALAAYRRLHAAAAGVLAEGGLLCASSCSSHVSAEDFAATLDDASLGRGDLRLLELHGQPKDHPTLPVWFEGRYLKFAVLG